MTINLYDWRPLIINKVSWVSISCIWSKSGINFDWFSTNKRSKFCFQFCIELPHVLFSLQLYRRPVTRGSSLLSPILVWVQWWMLPERSSPNWLPLEGKEDGLPYRCLEKIGCVECITGDLINGKTNLEYFEWTFDTWMWPWCQTVVYVECSAFIPRALGFQGGPFRCVSFIGFSTCSEAFFFYVLRVIHSQCCPRWLTHSIFYRQVDSTISPPGMATGNIPRWIIVPLFRSCYLCGIES